MQLVFESPQAQDQPIYKQLRDSLKRGILKGTLKPEEALPTARDLAGSLNLSLFTVTRAYEELSSEGLIEIVGNAARVCKQFPSFSKKEESPEAPRLISPVLSKYGQRLMQNGPSVSSQQFLKQDEEQQSFDASLVNRWRDLLSRNARYSENSPLGYVADPFGDPLLRETLADYLTRWRSVKCLPDQLVIFSGAQMAIDLMSRVLLNVGDVVACETSSTPFVRANLLAQGVQIFSVPVDESGLIVDRLYENPHVKVVYVAPSKYDPTMPVLRRLELLKWAQRTGGMILEDDRGSELLVGDRNVPSLQGLDSSEHVVYFSDFEKSMFPVLRLGYVILPRLLINVVHRSKALIENEFLQLEQKTLTEFINEGHFEKHLKRLRQRKTELRAV